MTRYLGIILLLAFQTEHLCGQSIFRTACKGNLIQLDSMLLKEDINVKDEKGRSLLHWAVACKQREIFDYLIDKEININDLDKDGASPLSMAVRFNNEEYLRLLVRLQKNDDWISSLGPGLMETATLNKNKSMLEILLGYGIDVNSLNKRGSTPLEIALRINENEIAELLITNGADQTLVRKYELKGPYLGQEEPGTTPVIFAPNFISTEEQEFGSIFNKKGNEFYFAVDNKRKNEIRYTRMENGVWTKPEVLLTHERYGYNDPFLSPDEDRLYFISKRALDGKGALKDVDIWYVEKEDEGWSEPINAGPNINTKGNEYYISFTRSGTLYFSSNGFERADSGRKDHDIYYSENINGEFQIAKPLGREVNTEEYEGDIFISSDESFLIFCSEREKGFGRGDLYISFKKQDGSWSKALNMGEEINTPGYEYCPFISHDGKYLFFTRNQDIFWVSTKVFENLRNKN